MRKIIYGMMTSLDGFIEGPNHELNWAIIDEEFHRHANERERTAGAYLYGRGLYETMAAYWPTADKDPNNPPYIIEYAQIWQSIPKIVFSRTLERVEGARLVHDHIAEEVARLKEQPGGDLIVGGAGIGATFLRLGLVDECDVYIHPVVLGSGTPMFPILETPLNLRLVETHQFATGVVYLQYQVIASGAAPGENQP